VLQLNATSTVTVGGVLSLCPGAVLRGTGTIDGVVENDGRVEPGNSVGTLAVEDYVQLNQGILSIEASSPSPGGYDVLQVDNDIMPAQFAGQLVFCDPNCAIQFQDGHTFGIVSCGAAGSAGGFQSALLPQLAPGLSWRVTIGSTGVTLRVTDCPADLTGDGQITQSDLGVLLSDFGCDAGIGGCPGDLTNDGLTTQSDLGLLLSGFGAFCP
jgi:hypothetical protein